MLERSVFINMNRGKNKFGTSIPSASKGQTIFLCRFLREEVN